jgi:hypothetical protein
MSETLASSATGPPVSKGHKREVFANLQGFYIRDLRMEPWGFARSGVLSGGSVNMSVETEPFASLCLVTSSCHTGTLFAPESP